MEKSEYEVVLYKFENEISEIQKEISILQMKRKESQKRIEREQKKLTSVFVGGTIRASMLQNHFNAEVVQRGKNELRRIDEFIFMLNLDIEKVKEKQKELHLIYRKKIKEKEMKRRKKEEGSLFDMKNFDS